MEWVQAGRFPPACFFVRRPGSAEACMLLLLLHPPCPAPAPALPTLSCRLLYLFSPPTPPPPPPHPTPPHPPAVGLERHHGAHRPRPGPGRQREVQAHARRTHAGDQPPPPPRGGAEGKGEWVGGGVGERGGGYLWVGWGGKKTVGRLLLCVRFFWGVGGGYGGLCWKALLVFLCARGLPVRRVGDELEMLLSVCA
jgi:hypothetical protein